MSDSRSTRVLIVEDNETARNTLAEVLRFWGYETETASDGVEALRKVPSFHPAVVISDLQMPRMGGIELLQALQRSVPSLACFIITGCGTPDRADVVNALRVVDYLDKPVDLERLRDGLQRCTLQTNVQARHVSSCTIRPNPHENHAA